MNDVTHQFEYVDINNIYLCITDVVFNETVIILTEHT